MNDPDKTHEYVSDDAGLPYVQPKQIGRYRIENVLGKGGFGVVYLAYDDQLQRLVAVKVPHPDRITRNGGGIEAYLTEARTVAKLDHPHIVPVYDVGTTDEFPCFIVSKFIDGNSLGARIRQSRLNLVETVRIVATVAEALHHAHKQGLVHRDIKPSNLLLDKNGEPFVADFGLALREEDIGNGPRFGGTPAYMSPEQARGEGHRVDGRSDIFSLGVVFYELVVGRRPFKSEKREELLEQITTVEARPPRQIDDQIPKELERICLKALSKKASERYTTARDFAEDLRQFLADLPSDNKAKITDEKKNESEISTAVSSATTSLASDSQLIKIVPKGLRSFDANDADFFLELLPGPRDRDGLPESIRFWKTRIEENEDDNTFSVGLIYGPSGCGKSSLMKAGLLPRLAKSVTSVYIEATSNETEVRLIKGLRRQLPDLPNDLGLVESLASLRRGRFLEPGQKVLLVLDQFEQWLHTKRGEANNELIQALRHCDGSRVQCIVMVRDDFWLAVSRFMKAIEVEILEGRNSALVDLFDSLHSRKLLAAFGRAFGRLPDKLDECSKEQNAFLDEAVAGLSQEGKVISVRLALFAEMVKGKTWTHDALKEVGGTEGVGVTFLEETFTAKTAPPQHRLHQKAAQAVLKSLLPEPGDDIKGHMRSQQELLKVSGYVTQPKDFDSLVRILDGELRLITPTDPDGSDEHSASLKPDAQYYQLTHDYLVHSLRNWLTCKQKESRRGRAELLLADRAGVWNARPENRQLPSLLQWLQIRLLTAKDKWTVPQRKMMRNSTTFHAGRGIVVAVMLAIVGWGTYEGNGWLNAHALRDRLLDAQTSEVPIIVQRMLPYRGWLTPLLHKHTTTIDARQTLHVSLALLPVDDSQVVYLYERLLNATPDELSVICDALIPHKNALLHKLWGVAHTPPKDKDFQRLRAAAALALYDPQSEQWANVQEAVANDLVNVPVVYLTTWMNSLRPVRGKLLAPLSDVYRSKTRENMERSLATSILADFAADEPELLADLLMDADASQFAVIYPQFKEQRERGLHMLTGEIGTLSSFTAQDTEQLAKRQANAAVALLRMNQPQSVWPLLKHTSDPRARSYLIHRLSPLGADPKTLVERLHKEPDVTIRRALLLSLGEFAENALSSKDRSDFLQTLQEVYLTHSDPGLHAATEWLLRKWHREEFAQQQTSEWIDAERRDKRLHDIEKSFALERENALPQWYVNSQGQTLVVIPGPVEFSMGSPIDEANRASSEQLHRRRIGRSFAISSKAVTHEQYNRCKQYRIHREMLKPNSDEPVNGKDWHQAAEYCNWLSEEEGIPEDQWCYIFTDSHTTLKSGYLSLSGYRLPTEAELEYATRAEATTARCYGESEELLSHYGWHRTNSHEQLQPVGRLKPNDLGLFDVHGNVQIWCQESFRAYPPEGHVGVIEDDEDSISVAERLDTAPVIGVSRGGSFGQLPYLLRSARRSNFLRTFKWTEVGFRLARTMPVNSITTIPPTTKTLLSYLAELTDDSDARFRTRLGALDKLAEYVVNHPEVWADMLMDADERQFAKVLSRCEQHGDVCLSRLIVETANESVLAISEPERERLAKRRANAAIGLLRLGHTLTVWPLLKHRGDPRVRSYIVHRLNSLGVDPNLLASRLHEEPESSSRRALLLSLGEYGEADLLPDARKSLLSMLQDSYRTIADPGIHSAIEWLLRQWEQGEWLKDVNDEWASNDTQRQERLGNIQKIMAADDRSQQWYVNGQGQTIVVLPDPEEFMMGSPKPERGREEVEGQHQRRIGRSFALSAKPVTMGQFQRFDAGFSVSEPHLNMPELPVVATSWYQAAAYCNWISKEEGIPEDQWCYEITNAETKVRNDHLSLIGFRLPTEAEMEYATRAGATTAHFYGETDELLAKYAWYQKNSKMRPWPVGLLKPNDFGLFDVQGNVCTWCQDAFTNYPASKNESFAEDQETNLMVMPTLFRVLRGGSFVNLSSNVRSAQRFAYPPNARFTNFGFRLARTIPSISNINP